MKKHNETWLQFAVRMAAYGGLQKKVLQRYRKLRQQGLSDKTAAVEACRTSYAESQTEDLADALRHALKLII
jgi:ribosomal protein L7/L12